MAKFHCTVLRRALLTISLCFTATQAQALTITTTKSYYEPAGVRYYFEVSNWDANSSWSPCTVDDSRVTACAIGLIANRPGLVINTAGTYFKWDVPARRNSNMGELLSDLKTKGFQIPLTGSILVPKQYANNNLCITFTYAHTGPNLGAAVNPWGPCSKVKAPALQCEIKGDITINHRSLYDNKVDGAMASTQLYLQCLGPTSVTVSTSRTDASGVQLRSDGSLYSKITVNGKDATTGINVQTTKDQATTLDVTSTLSSRGTVAPGEFSGFTVITVSPP
ncbi:hypothetical protein [Pseudomonas sp. Irchel 3H3]|uniref:MrpH family fimbial adhesin n=1 Tax=Pseudomonas sp. Irchel 3H3 TaxID=2009038 RepID=UPI00117A7BF7|nr:hypothetical protein [Pseudomonas sp. Irchel 3H3]